MRGESFFVVGGAGFIGSHFTDRLLADPAVRRVTLFDNFSCGREWHYAHHAGDDRLRVVRADVKDLPALRAAMDGHDVVIHLASNPDIARAATEPSVDFWQGTALTHNVVEAMRTSSAKRILYASGSGVYGDLGEREATEDHGPLVPVSTYGASKLAGEALISAFVECFHLHATIFRFGNVVGPRGTHGAALDFLKKLRDARTYLEVLGDGRQSKPYLFVTDCVDGMLFGLEHAKEKLNIHNLAPSDATSVARIAELCVAASPYPDAAIRYTGGDRGWPGDVPRSRMDPSKLAALGFRVSLTSDQAVERAVAALAREVFGEPAA